VTAAPGTTRSVLRRLLLTMIGASPFDTAALSGLSAEDWSALDGMAGQHRLQPILHARFGDCNLVPDVIRREWRGAYRYWKMMAVAAQSELRKVSNLLASAGYEPMALKGAWLAERCYADPALRPLRDLDILVTPDTVIGAFDCLLAAGYRPIHPIELSLTDIVRIEKHMPPLQSPTGICIELHHRMWEVEGQMDHVFPDRIETEVRARAIAVDGLRYPCAEDMLAHLIVHAVYSHRLDCGPLVLSDIAALLRSTPVDWPHLWQRARDEEWSEGAALVLALVHQHDPDLPGLGEMISAWAVPDALIDSAADLLLQDLDTRRSAGFFATLRAGLPGTFRRRLLGNRQGDGHGSDIARDLKHEGGFWGWAVQRTGRTVSQWRDPEVRRQSGQLAAISRWLNRKD
jgi:hypothetical protein